VSQNVRGATLEDRHARNRAELSQAREFENGAIDVASQPEIIGADDHGVA
jgi:hypothetical protein